MKPRFKFYVVQNRQSGQTSTVAVCTNCLSQIITDNMPQVFGVPTPLQSHQCYQDVISAPVE